MNKSGIYKIINFLNKKIYIGSSINLKNRWGTHKNELRKNKHDNQYLQNAWNKYGEENFIFEVIIYCSSEKCLFFEQKCLDIFKPWNKENGYNISKDAKAPLKGRNHSLETKQKLSLANSGENHPMFGKHLSDETKQKLSGENHPMFGKQHSDETKQKMSLAMSGENNPMFGKHLFGENSSMFGKHHSEKTKQKIRKSNEKLMRIVKRTDPITR